VNLGRNTLKITRWPTSLVDPYLTPKPHHLAGRSPTRIVREIARVLKPGGQTRVMVYNREGTIARYILVRHYLLGGEFRGSSPDETLWRWTDGYSARYYHQEHFEDLFRGLFEEVSSVILARKSMWFRYRAECGR
jgi:SAM-dependent methyltransferase